MAKLRNYREVLALLWQHPDVLLRRISEYRQVAVSTRFSSNRGQVRGLSVGHWGTAVDVHRTIHLDGPSSGLNPVTPHDFGVNIDRVESNLA